MSTYLPFIATAWIVFQEQLPLLGEEPCDVLRIGDHVANREDPNKTVGVLTHFEEDLAFVSSPQWMRDRHFPFSRYDREFYDDPGKLVRTEGYSIEQLACAIYGGMHHSYCDVPRSEFDGWRGKKILCRHKDCTNNAIGVGLFNVWGTVFPAPMCVDHAHLNGCCGESSPFVARTEKILA
ncbi:MAG: hypothetical protein ACAH17_02235 [Candidatus Paceibacterota bacterium]